MNRSGLDFASVFHHQTVENAVDPVLSGHSFPLPGGCKPGILRDSDLLVGMPPHQCQLSLPIAYEEHQR